jgi:hypothetical protein
MSLDGKVAIVTGGIGRDTRSMTGQTLMTDGCCTTLR